MDDIESYLILKYGNLHRAFNMWMNTYQDMPPELHDAINEFFWERKGAKLND